MIVVYITIGSILFPLFGTIILFKSGPSYVRWLGFLLVLSLIFDINSLIFPELRSLVNDIYPVIELLILSIIYVLLIDNKKFRIGVTFIVGAYILYKILTYSLLSDISSQIFTYRALTSFWFLFLSVSYFVVLQKQPPVKSILHYPAFWFNTAILTYFAGTIILLATYVVFKEAKDMENLYFYVHGFFNILQNALFTLALYLIYKEMASE